MTEIKGVQPAKRGAFAFLARRSNRKEYWLSVAILMAIAIAAGFFTDISGTSWVGPLMLVQIPRLHDFGRSGWWAVAAQLVSVALALALWPLVSLEIAVGLGALVNIGLIVAIGAIAGDPEENRFGKRQTRLFQTWT